jgi:Chaperone of endosialidase
MLVVKDHSFIKAPIGNMNTEFKLIKGAALLLFLLSFNLQLSTAFAQGTAFTYQGRLNDGANPANGSYDLMFTLFATNSSGVPIAGPVTNSATAISNGLFTAMIDFGPGVFTGGSNWLEIAVRTNSASSFIALAPRQQVMPVPYAITAENANYLPGLTVQQNTSGAPDVIGGASDNFASSDVVGATIAGGGATNFPIIGRLGTTYVSYTNSVTGNFGTVGGGGQNTAGGLHATVGGGFGNTASGSDATVSGGTHNTASGQDGTVSGGSENTASGNYSTVSGGFANTASNLDATVGGGANNNAGGQFTAVGGGYHNFATTNYATVPGGDNNTASGFASFAAGANAQALHDGAFVWADNTGGTFASTGSNQFSVRASGGIRLAGDVQIDNSAYHYLSLDGGNSLGFLYGSYPAFGDGIHLGYNYYADASGTGHVINTGGATSRISAGYGTISLLTGYVNGAPYSGLTISGPSVPVSITSTGIGIGLYPNASAQTPQASIDLYYDIVYRGNGFWWAGITSSGNFGFGTSFANPAVAYIDTSGNYHQSSDLRLKRDIANLDNTLERLLKLRPVSYHFHDAPANAPLSLGFIAQEVQPLFPDIVGEQTNGVKDLVYSELIPITVRSIQELNQKLETKLKQQDSEIQGLKQSHDTLARQLKELQTAVQALQERN